MSVAIDPPPFLRDREELDAIDWHSLAESSAAAGSVTIRVWSAACATGEEPYSLALLAAEAFAPADPLVHILATDVSNAALVAAARGRYRERSARALEERVRERYFNPAGEELVVSERLRRTVRFRAHDLACDAIPPPGYGQFELIVCRNVLVRFDSATAVRVRGALEGALAPGGVLVLGAADGYRADQVQARPADVAVSPTERIRRRRSLHGSLGSAPRPQAST